MSEEPTPFDPHPHDMRPGLADFIRRNVPPPDDPSMRARWEQELRDLERWEQAAGPIPDAEQERLKPSKDPDDPRPIEVHFVATPTLQERMHAAEWLAERGYGRAVEIVEATGKPAFNLIFLGHRRDPLTSGELDRPKSAPTKALDA